MNDLFRRFAAKTSEVLGSPWAFLLALMVVAVWALVGPAVHYSENWQLVINTGTTIVTFLMVFLIQNTQNRDVKALHLKLDELIRAGEGARNRLVDLEKLSDKDLITLEKEFHRLARRGGKRAADAAEEAKETREDRRKSRARAG